MFATRYHVKRAALDGVHATKPQAIRVNELNTCVRHGAVNRSL